MSNLSQFFGGGAPTNIIRGSTAVSSGAFRAPFGGSRLTAVATTVSTGIFVDRTKTYMTQGFRGEFVLITVGNGIVTSCNGSGAARIDPTTGQILITSGLGFVIYTGFSDVNYPCSAIVDWEAVVYS